MHAHAHDSASGARRRDRGPARPGELEAAVLATLQAAGVALSPGEVRDRLDADLAYTTGGDDPVAAARQGRP